MKSKKEFEAFVSEYKKDLEKHPTDGFQRFELPHGLKIEGRDDTKGIWCRLVPDESILEGAEVLDMGCDLGYFCILASIAGAKYVLGVDKENSRVELARRLARLYDLDETKIRFGQKRFGVTEYLPMKFDVVIASQLIYHVRPAEALWKILTYICKDWLLLYTKISTTEREDVEVTYIPTMERLERDLRIHLFKIEHKEMFNAENPGQQGDINKWIVLCQKVKI